MENLESELDLFILPLGLIPRLRRGGSFSAPVAETVSYTLNENTLTLSMKEGNFVLTRKQRRDPPYRKQVCGTAVNFFQWERSDEEALRRPS